MSSAKRPGLTLTLDHLMGSGRLETMLTYKREAKWVIQNAEEAGEEPPAIYPHPDDVRIDPSSGEITYEGPRDERQAEMLRQVTELFLSIRTERDTFAGFAARARSPERRREWEELRDDAEARLGLLQSKADWMAQLWPRHWPPR